MKTLIKWFVKHYVSKDTLKTAIHAANESLAKIEVDEARGADLTAVERKNLARMQTALDECIEYHDRLHGVAIKAIDFDLDDGVVVNYAKFGDVLAKIK